MYTQYPIIRNGHIIRYASEIGGNFKKRLVSRLNLRNALKKLRNFTGQDFLAREHFFFNSNKEKRLNSSTYC